MNSDSVIFLPSGTVLHSGGSVGGSPKYRPTWSERRQDRVSAALAFDRDVDEALRIPAEILKLLARSVVNNYTAAQGMRALTLRKAAEKSRRPSAYQLANPPHPTTWD